MPWNITSRSELGATLYEDEFEEIDEEIAKLLFVAGETGPNGTTRGLPKFLRKMEPKNDLRLLTLCRRAIRRHLLEASPVNLLLRIPRLELPQSLEEFLLYNLEKDPYHRDDDSDISTSDIDRYRINKVRELSANERWNNMQRRCLERPDVIVNEQETKRKAKRKRKEKKDVVEVPRARKFPDRRHLQQDDSGSESESEEKSESGSEGECGSESGAESVSEASSDC